MDTFFHSRHAVCVFLASKLRWGMVAAVAFVPAVASAQVVKAIATTMRVSPVSRALDYLHAKPMPLPQAKIAPGPAPALSAFPFQGPAGGAPGAEGSGKESPVSIPISIVPPPSGPTTSPQEFGSSQQPYTTSRANGFGSLNTSYYPFRAAGKLYFTEPAGTYVCSASFIKPGIIVTAAHCVVNRGQNQVYSGWTFYPGLNGDPSGAYAAPYGAVTVKALTYLNSYYSGTDSCSGAICPDDVALLITSQLTGNQTGWFGYWYGGAGFNNSNQIMISQLGYPQALDNGTFMERTDSLGYINSNLNNNTIIGSLMTPGSSGGPWVANLGRQPIIASGSGYSYGTYPDHNVVVGVTSWAYNDQGVKQMGASPFNANTIQTLINSACGAYPGNC